jgi:hypothetical protein
MTKALFPETYIGMFFVSMTSDSKIMVPST